MLSAALECGIGYDDFWNMAINEITDCIAAKNREQARFIYRTALLTGIAINNPNAFPRSVQDAFPALFKKSEDWRVFKDYMKQYQKRHNVDFAKGKNNDGRTT